MYWRKSSLMALMFVCMGAIASACNIPVFRYALERWRPDTCEMIVFYDTLTPQNHAKLETIRNACVERGGSANLEVKLSHVTSETAESRRDLWATLSENQKPKLPYVLIRSSLGSGKTVTHWYGSLQELPGNVEQSPARRELTKRLMRGDSVVWLILKSKDSQKNESIRQRLKSQLDQLSQRLELPEGIGLPGSELFSEVPLFLKFSILEIDPQDESERLLVRMMAGFEPDNQDEPLVAPVFGRGRVLEVIRASQLDSGLIGDLTMFLCGACSCQVKERNPGFDLLLSIDWNKELYGDNGSVPPAVTSLERAPTKPQEPISIPPGRRK